MPTSEYKKNLAFFGRGADQVRSISALGKAGSQKKMVIDAGGV